MPLIEKDRLSTIKEIKGGPHMAAFGWTFPCWITRMVKPCFLCNLSLSGFIFSCQTYFCLLFFFLSPVSCCLLLFRSLQTVKNNSGHRIFKVDFSTLHANTRHSLIFIYWSLVKRDNAYLMLFRKCDYSLLPASSFSLRLKGQQQKRLLYTFYCIVTLRMAVHVFAASRFGLNLPELDTVKSTELQSGSQPVLHLSSLISLKRERAWAWL